MICFTQAQIPDRLHMKIAVAVTADYARVSGHAGRARRWLLYDVPASGALAPPSPIELTADIVFHHHDGKATHPLDGIEALIAQSAGDGFLARMRARGVDVGLTSEADPAKAVADYLGHSLVGPRPRPIGGLICKTLDLFSKHR